MSPTAADTKPILELSGIRAGYGIIDVLHGVDLAIQPGQVVALLGPNGAGKSTTLKVASAQIRPSAGRLLLAGADVTMMASILLMNGPSVLSAILEELEAWLEEKEYDSVEQLKGSMSRGNCPDPSALERANYMKALTNYTMEHPLPPGS